MRSNKKAKSLSLRQRLHKAIREIYPRKHYSIEFQSGVIGGVRLHQELDDGVWTWDSNFQDWNAGLGFGRIKDGDDFCLQINRRYHESVRIWGSDAGDYIEDHLYVTVENENFKLRAG